MFWRGVCYGLAVAATFALVFTAYEVRHAEAMYRDLGSAPLPEITKLVFGPWRMLAPIVSLAALAALVYRRPASWVPYAVTAAVIFGATLFTWYAMQLPLDALVENISG